MSADPANDAQPKLSAEAVYDLVLTHLREPLAFAVAHTTPAIGFPREPLADPAWVAGEILRLALIGAIAEGEHPDAPVSLVLRFADHMLQRSR